MPDCQIDCQIAGLLQKEFFLIIVVDDRYYDYNVNVNGEKRYFVIYKNRINRIIYFRSVCVCIYILYVNKEIKENNEWYSEIFICACKDTA